jgi:hypothetical protein
MAHWVGETIPTMQLLTKFKSELRNVKSEAFLSFLEGLDVVEFKEGRLQEPITDPLRTIGIGSGAPIRQIIGLFLREKIQHFVQVNTQGFLNDLFASAVMIKRPEKFMESPLPFFIHNFRDKLAEKNKVKHLVVNFLSTKDKPAVLTATDKFINESPGIKHFRDQARIIVDELLMNALFGLLDKPRPTPAVKNTPTIADFESRIFLSCDESRLLIGCDDPYGAVRKEDVLNGLAHTFGGGGSAAANDMPLQGLSYKLILQNSCSFYAVSQRNKRTLLCVSLPLTPGQKRFESHPKNLHFCFF